MATDDRVITPGEHYDAADLDALLTSFQNFAGTGVGQIQTQKQYGSNPDDAGNQYEYDSYYVVDGNGQRIPVDIDEEGNYYLNIDTDNRHDGIGERYGIPQFNGRLRIPLELDDSGNATIGTDFSKVSMKSDGGTPFFQDLATVIATSASIWGPAFFNPQLTAFFQKLGAVPGGASVIDAVEGYAASLGFSSNIAPILEAASTAWPDGLADLVGGELTPGAFEALASGAPSTVAATVTTLGKNATTLKGFLESVVSTGGAVAKWVGDNLSSVLQGAAAIWGANEAGKISDAILEAGGDIRAGLEGHADTIMGEVVPYAQDIQDQRSLLGEEAKTEIDQNVDTYIDTVRSSSDTFTDSISRRGQQYTQDVGMLGEDYTRNVADIGRQSLDTLGEYRTNARDQVFSDANEVSDRFTNLRDSIGTQFSTVNDRIGSGYQMLGQDIAGRYDSLGNSVMNMMTTAGNTAKGEFSSLASDVRADNKGLVDEYKTGATAVGDWAQGAFDDAMFTPYSVSSTFGSASAGPDGMQYTLNEDDQSIVNNNRKNILSNQDFIAQFNPETAGADEYARWIEMMDPQRDRDFAKLQGRLLAQGTLGAGTTGMIANGPDGATYGSFNPAMGAYLYGVQNANNDYRMQAEDRAYGRINTMLGWNTDMLGQNQSISQDLRAYGDQALTGRRDNIAGVGTMVDSVGNIRMEGLGNALEGGLTTNRDYSTTMGRGIEAGLEGSLSGAREYGNIGSAGLQDATRIGIGGLESDRLLSTEAIRTDAELGSEDIAYLGDALDSQRDLFDNADINLLSQTTTADTNAAGDAFDASTAAAEFRATADNTADKVAFDTAVDAAGEELAARNDNVRMAMEQGNLGLDDLTRIIEAGWKTAQEFIAQGFAEETAAILAALTNDAGAVSDILATVSNITNRYKSGTTTTTTTTTP